MLVISSLSKCQSCTNILVRVAEIGFTILLSVALLPCLSVCLSVCLSIYLSICLSVILSVCLTVCLSVELCCVEFTCVEEYICRLRFSQNRCTPLFFHRENAKLYSLEKVRVRVCQQSSEGETETDSEYAQCLCISLSFLSDFFYCACLLFLCVLWALLPDSNKSINNIYSLAILHNVRFLRHPVYFATIAYR